LSSKFKARGYQKMAVSIAPAPANIDPASGRSADSHHLEKDRGSKRAGSERQAR
jgi:hypothetical protein